LSFVQIYGTGGSSAWRFFFFFQNAKKTRVGLRRGQGVAEGERGGKAAEWRRRGAKSPPQKQQQRRRHQL